MDEAEVTKNSLTSTAVAILAVAAFAVVLNPEGRALMLVVEVLGVDVVTFLFAAQVRTMYPMVESLMQLLARDVCASASVLSGHALKAFVSLLPVRLFAVLICPLLLTSAFLLQCDKRAMP